METKNVSFKRDKEVMFSRGVESFSILTIGQRWTSQDEMMLRNAKGKRDLYYDLLMDTLEKLGSVRRQSRLNAELAKNENKYRKLHDEWTIAYNKLIKKKKNAPRGGSGGGGMVRTRQRVAVPLYK